MLAAKYLFNGSEGFERFCSSTLEVVNGTPYYFTGEEAVLTRCRRCLPDGGRHPA